MFNAYIRVIVVVLAAVGMGYLLDRAWLFWLEVGRRVSR